MQLERPRPEQQSQGEDVETASSLRLGPVPLPPDFSAYRSVHDNGGHRALSGQQDEATPASVLVRTDGTADDHDLLDPADATQQAASHEILASLAAVEASFTETLHGIIRRSFPSAVISRGACDTVTGGPPDLRASTSSSANGHSTRTAEAKCGPAVHALLVDLRRACDAVQDPFADGEMRQVFATSAEQSGSVQEIRSRLDYLASYFPSTVESGMKAPLSAPQVAKNLASLLAMTSRLQALYKASPRLALSRTTSASPLATPGLEPRTSMDFFDKTLAASPEPSPEIYSTLSKQAKALQSASLSRQESQDSNHVVRAIEDAEMELLWGRMSDLLDATAEACKLSKPAPASRASQRQAQSNHEYLFGDMQTPLLDQGEASAQFQGLPQYASLAPPSYEQNDLGAHEDTYSDVKEEDSEDQSSAVQRQVSRGHMKAPTVSDEKMQIDLDRMASAIERLYISAPQLANQRVDAVRQADGNRQQLREMQLTKLGTAIERLCKGRMEDQRASLLQVNPYATARFLAKSKDADSKQESLERLLDDIDRASARTLDDQRVSMSSRQKDALMGARRTARLAALDLHLETDELAFRDLLIDSVGKGRLTSQDATFPASRSSTPTTPSFSSRLAMKRRSLAHLWEDNMSNGDKRNRGRSSSVGATPATIPPIPPIPADLPPESNTLRPALRKRFSVSRLLSSGSQKDTSSLIPPSGRKSAKASPSTSRPTSTHSLMTSQTIYTVEEMINLGSMMLQVWESSSLSPAEAPYTPEAWSIACTSARSAQLERPEMPPLDLTLTSEVSPSLLGPRSLDLTYKADHYEVKMPTAASAIVTRSREDLDIAVPYSAREFRKYQPTSLTCASCSAQLANLSRITRYNDLPSEHWAELLDAWMCHPDQTLSKEIIEKGNNIWPQPTQALISLGGIILASENTKGWMTATELEPVQASDGKWLAAKCKSCRALVGRTSPGPRRDISDISAYVRFQKVAIQPAITSLMPVYSLSLHVTTALLETSLARAIHRFVVEEEEDEGKPVLVLWLFNPFVRIYSNDESFQSSQPVTAAKILYKAGNLADADVARIIGNAEYESIIYPRRICTQLADLLKASSVIYPKSHQKLGDWNVGWLERDIARA